MWGLTAAAARIASQLPRTRLFSFSLYWQMHCPILGLLKNLSSHVFLLFPSQLKSAICLKSATSAAKNWHSSVVHAGEATFTSSKHLNQPVLL